MITPFNCESLIFSEGTLLSNKKKKKKKKKESCKPYVNSPLINKILTFSFPGKCS